MIDDSEKLRSEQIIMERDISTSLSRLNSVREEKIKVAHVLSNIKRVEEELDRMSEEKSQVELDLKVISFFLKKLADLNLLHKFYFAKTSHSRFR